MSPLCLIISLYLLVSSCSQYDPWHCYQPGCATGADASVTGIGSTHSATTPATGVAFSVWPDQMPLLSLCSQSCNRLFSTFSFSEGSSLPRALCCSPHQGLHALSLPARSAPPPNRPASLLAPGLAPSKDVLPLLPWCWCLYAELPWEMGLCPRYCLQPGTWPLQVLR